MKTNRKNVGFRLLLPLCLLSVSARAQQPPPSPPPQRPVFLTEALQAMPAASVGDGAVALTVGSQGIMPVPSPPPPETDAGLPENPIPTPPPKLPPRGTGGSAGGSATSTRWPRRP